MEHGTDACLFHAGKGGVQADSGQCADHEEFAQPLGGGDDNSRDGEDAGDNGHGQEAQDKPGEDLGDAEVGFQLAVAGIFCQCFLALEVQLDEGECHHRGDNGQSSSQLDHGGEITGTFRKSIAGGDHGGGVVDGGACPDAEGLITHAQGTAHNGEEDDHGHVKQEGGGHGVSYVVIRGIDSGGDSGDGAATADAGAGGDEVGELPVQSQRPADEIAAAKAGQQGKDHHRQRQPSHIQNGLDVQRQTQQNDGDAQDLFGGELQSRREGGGGGAEMVDDHAHEHGDDRRADEVDGQQAFQPPGQRRNGHGENESGQ